MNAPHAQPPLKVGVTGERITGVSAGARSLHREILRGFASTGRPPDRDRLAAAAGSGLDGLLRELHDRDVVRLDEHGAILAAYPFSGRPTAHTVAIAGAATVYAMCAIDALGISAMLGRDTRIRSTDPHNGRPVTVTVHHGQAEWEPATAVVVNGVTATDADCCSPDAAGPIVPAIDRCCTVLNFFTNRASARAWLAEHPAVSGVVLDQAQALRTGVETFGRLLDETAGSQTDMTRIEADVRRYIAVVEANLRHLGVVPILYRLLSAGEPVDVGRLAERTGADVDDLRAELTRHPGTDWDEHGRIVGFNLTLRPTPHTFTFDGRTVYAFCADGALELPVVLGRPGVVASPCRATGQLIRVEVTPTRVVTVDPRQAVVSKVRPTAAVEDVRRDICGLGHFFSSPTAAAEWLANTPDGMVDPVGDEYQVVRQAMAGLGWAADSAAASR